MYIRLPAKKSFELGMPGGQVLDQLHLLIVVGICRRDICPQGQQECWTITVSFVLVSHLLTGFN